MLVNNNVAPHATSLMFSPVDVNLDMAWVKIERNLCRKKFGGISFAQLLKHNNFQTVIVLNIGRNMWIVHG